MNREIKFRTYHKKFGMNYLENLKWFDDLNLDGWEVMQFTGLFDINGKGIYEGDIVSYRQHYFNIDEDVQYSYPKKRKVIGWNYDRWNVHETAAGQTEIEVIGNIYENPELLEK